MADQKKYVAYAGTYTHEKSLGIHVYDVDLEDGIFTERSVAQVHNPSYLTVSYDKRFLYSIADEGVASFSIDENGDLTKLNEAWIGGMRGCYVEVDHKNRYLFVGGYHDGRVTMMKLNKDGSIGEISDGIFHEAGAMMTANRRIDHAKVTCVKLTPDQKFLCAVDYGLNQIKVYEIDYEFGKLHLVDIVRSNIDAGCRIIRFSSDGKYAYVCTGEAKTIEVYTYEDTEAGPVFERIQTIDVLDHAAENASCTCLRISDDDEYVYVTVDGIGGFAFLKRHEDGTLERAGFVYSCGDFPKSLCIFPGKKYVGILNHDDNELRTFCMDYEKNCALMNSAPVSIDQPNCIRVVEL